jgi:hypothetical protein
MRFLNLAKAKQLGGRRVVDDRRRAMENENFNLSLRRFLKEVGITSQQEIERVVRERGLAGQGRLKTKMVLTAEGTDLRHEINGEIDLG